MTQNRYINLVEDITYITHKSHDIIPLNQERFHTNHTVLNFHKGTNLLHKSKTLVLYPWVKSRTDIQKVYTYSVIGHRSYNLKK